MPVLVFRDSPFDMDSLPLLTSEDDSLCLLDIDKSVSVLVLLLLEGSAFLFRDEQFLNIALLPFWVSPGDLLFSVSTSFSKFLISVLTLLHTIFGSTTVTASGFANVTSGE
jgi:hypothetical protein